MEQTLPFEFIFPAALGVIAAIAWYWKTHSKHFIVYDYQRALHFRDGTLLAELGPGRHRYTPGRSQIEVFDMRQQPLQVAGQEILTQDNISIRLSLAGTFLIENPRVLQASSPNHTQALHQAAQLALRGSVAGLTLEEVLTKRAELDAALLEKVAAEARPLGVSVTSLAVRDVMLPANLKKAYAGVAEARKEAERQMEKARGEQAVLRNLSNAARLMAEQPALLQARMIQALGQGNNSIVLGADGFAWPAVPPQKPRK
ncbi:MAG: slipin family protein [Hyphomicrobiales bacterium]